jgi:SAM-dependent methyltransferase
MKKIVQKIADKSRIRLAKVCTVCGWRGRAFGPMRGPTYVRENAVCPQCGSHERHRALIKYIDEYMDLADNVVLDIAPVKYFREYFDDRSARYVSLDLFAPAMVKSDVLNTPFADKVFDCVICYHVLEHITPDVAAMREIRRILKASGVALIQVPFDPAKSTTLEYDAPDTMCHDHVRSHYGMDVQERIAEAGFSFEAQDLGKLFPRRVQRKHGFDKASGTTFICRR